MARADCIAFGIEIWGRDEERRLRHKYVLLLGTRENKKAARFFSSCKAISILTIRGHAKALKDSFSALVE